MRWISNVEFAAKFYKLIILISIKVYDVLKFSWNLIYIFRWIYHHSILDGQYGDGVILGASSTKQLVENLDISSKGPLDEKVVKVIEDCWSDTCFSCPNYFR